MALLAPGMESVLSGSGQVFVLSISWLAHSVLPLILGVVLGDVFLQAVIIIFTRGGKLARVEM